MQPKIVLLIFVSGKAHGRSEQGPARLAPPAGPACWPRLLGPPIGPADRARRARDQPAASQPPANRHPADTPTGSQVVLTGGKLRKEIYAAFEQIYPVLQEFRKSTIDAPPVAA